MPSPDPIPTSEQHPADPRPRLQLSLTQLIASALAAVTATIAASYFGVSGTVLGAALASVVTVTGNALYGHSLRRTGARVRQVVPVALVRRAGEPATPAPVAPGLPPASMPARGRGWPRFALASGALFLLVVGVVTGIELAAGKPLQSVVHHESGRGTTFFGPGTPASSGGSPRPSTGPTTGPPTRPSTAPVPSTPEPKPTPTVPSVSPSTRPPAPAPTPSPSGDRPTPSTASSSGPSAGPSPTAPAG